MKLRSWCRSLCWMFAALTVPTSSIRLKRHPRLPQSEVKISLNIPLDKHISSFIHTRMEGTAAASATPGADGYTTGESPTTVEYTGMSLLEVQSEQLALKLQREADRDTRGSGSGGGGADSAIATANMDGGVAGGSGGSSGHPAAPGAASVIAAHTSSSVQGAWGTPGRSTADFLRTANSPAGAASSQVSSSSPSSSLARPTPSTTAAAGTSLVVVPLSAASVGALVAMGIDEAWAAAALRRCGGADVSRAVDFCFSHDMKDLVAEDARALEAAAAGAGAGAASSPEQGQQQQQQQQQQQPQPDSDSDMAFAMALDQEERRIFEARRSSAAATLSTEQGAFGSKVRVAATASSGGAVDFSGGGVAAAEHPPQRWGVADAEAMMDRGEGLLPSESEFYDEDGDGGGGEEGDG
ncbi:unnamed protein product, partial [Scytosiphon promiscuus]